MSLNIPNSLLKLGTFEFKINVANLPSRTKVKFLREANSGVVFSYGQMSKLAVALRKQRGLPVIHFSGGKYPSLRWFNIPRGNAVWAELDKLPALVALADDRREDTYRKNYQVREEIALRDRAPTASCAYFALAGVELYKYLNKTDFPTLDINEHTIISLNQSYF